MKFQVTSTGGHLSYTEDYNGTEYEFIKFKFGSPLAMMDQGCTISVVEETGSVEPTPEVESRSVAKRKKASV